MSYKVIAAFKDIKKDNHIYNVGDIYPKEGVKVTKARIEELSTTKNQHKQIFIEEVKKDATDSNE